MILYERRKNSIYRGTKVSPLIVNMFDMYPRAGVNRSINLLAVVLAIFLFSLLLSNIEHILSLVYAGVFY